MKRKLEGLGCLVVMLGVVSWFAYTAIVTAQTQPVVTTVSPPERVIVNPTAAQKPASNTNAVATLGQFAGRKWAITRVGWSYTAVPTGGQLIVAWTDAGNTARTETYYISAGGPGELHWPDGSPLTVPADVAPTITLTAGGVGISGSVYYMAKKE